MLEQVRHVDGPAIDQQQATIGIGCLAEVADAALGGPALQAKPWGFFVVADEEDLAGPIGVIVVSTWLFLRPSAEVAMVPTKAGDPAPTADDCTPRYEYFEPWLYSVDVVLPVVDCTRRAIGSPAPSDLGASGTGRLSGV